MSPKALPAGLLDRAPSEVSNAILHGSRNFVWTTIHLILFGRGIVPVLGETSKGIVAELDADSLINALGVRLFGASGLHSVNVRYPFPEPKHSEFPESGLKESRRVAFQYLFSLIPYFFLYRNCLGPLDRITYDAIEKEAFFTYMHELTPSDLPDDRWQESYGRPVMRRVVEVERSIEARLFRTKKVQRCIDAPWFRSELVSSMRDLLNPNDVAFLETHAGRLKTAFFESAHDCFDRLGRVAAIFAGAHVTPNGGV